MVLTYSKLADRDAPLHEGPVTTQHNGNRNAVLANPDLGQQTPSCKSIPDYIA